MYKIYWNKIVSIVFDLEYKLLLHTIFMCYFRVSGKRVNINSYNRITEMPMHFREAFISYIISSL